MINEWKQSENKNLTSIIVLHIQSNPCMETAATHNLQGISKY